MFHIADKAGDARIMPANTARETALINNQSDPEWSYKAEVLPNGKARVMVRDSRPDLETGHGGKIVGYL